MPDLLEHVLVFPVGDPALATRRALRFERTHLTRRAKSQGRFGKQDFVYLPEEDVYRCLAGERLTYRYTNEEDGKTLRRY
jgi:hypothetical protein